MLDIVQLSGYGGMAIRSNVFALCRGVMMGSLSRFVFVFLLGGWSFAVAGAEPAAGSASLSSDLGQLTLRQAEIFFAARNRELQFGRRLVEGAEADRVSAGQRPNPNLYLNATQIGHTYPPNYDAGGANRRADMTVGLNQLFERGNKRELRMGAADSNVIASRGDYADIAAPAEGRAVRRLLRSGRRAGHACASSLETAAFVPQNDGRGRAQAQGRRHLGRRCRTHPRRRAARAERRAHCAGGSVESADAACLCHRRRARTPPASTRPTAGRFSRPPPPRSTSTACWPGGPTCRRRRRASRRPKKTASSRARCARAMSPRWCSSTARRGAPIAISTSANTFGVGVSVPLFTNYYYRRRDPARRGRSAFARAKITSACALVAVGEIAARAVGPRCGARTRPALSRLAARSAQKAADAAEFAYSRGAIGVMDLLDARRQLLRNPPRGSGERRPITQSRWPPGRRRWRSPSARRRKKFALLMPPRCAHREKMVVSGNIETIRTGSRAACSRWRRY